MLPGPSRPAGTLIAYFTERTQARAALWRLYRRGFRRTAVAHKTAAGTAPTWDLFIWRRALRVSVTTLLGLGLVALGLLAAGLPLDARPALTLLLAGGLAGALGSALWLRRATDGVERQLLENHVRWLLPEETVLILQAPIDTLREAVAVLRANGETAPAVFVLHPQRAPVVDEAGRPGTLLSPALVQEHARQLAAEHELDPRPRRNTKLLQKLQQARRGLHQACADLSEASRLDQGVPPTAEWLLDNEYVAASNARDVQLNLSRRFYQELPALANQADQGLPRIYTLARALVANTELRLDRQNIQAFVEAYQTARALTMGELWAFPQMLRIALLASLQTIAARALTELRAREMADFWSNRLITANRSDHNQLFAILAEIAKAHPQPSPYFAAQLVDRLFDEEAALLPVQGWLERTFRQPLSELNLREQNRQTKDQISVGNAFTSLRQLAVLDWRQIFEHLSRVEQVLRQDPAGIYAQMDFGTRDRYRRAVEALTRHSDRTEVQVAQRAVALAAARTAGDDDRGRHVGTYLIGAGRPELARLMGSRETLGYRLRQWLYRQHSAVYLGGLTGLSTGLILLIARLSWRGQAWPVQLLIGLLLVIPVSQLALEILNYGVTRLLPPVALPKLDFEAAGVPDAWRALVVVPVLLTDQETIRAEVEKLEIRYLANPEDNLLFSLFTDYTDSNQAQQADDAGLLACVTEGLQDLNRRHGRGRFYLLHRERTWNAGEQQFIGWERKRGKLEELNGLIDGTRAEAAPPLVYVGDAQPLADVKFVITLDSDTQLPVGTARRLIETLAHPLNRPRFDAAGRILAGTYALIQPRVSPSLPSTSASPFSRLFADAVGIDPYTRAVSDVNQDLTREGSYHGKAIYDVRAFSRVLSGRFPEGLLLSHDLIEGAHVRVGLASDIELYDEFPQGYLSYTRRQHRWIRGDWQIADWVLPWVPQPDGRRGPNPLPWFNRWKILDNLRRSLLPAASLGLLVAAWLTAGPLGWLATLLVVMQLLFQPLVQPVTLATTRRGYRSVSVAKVAHDLLRAAADAALLPHQAGLALDAILRVGYRRLISHRGLLAWTSAQVAADEAPDQRSQFVRSMLPASLFSVLVAGALRLWQPASLALAWPWLGLWALSPLVGWALNLRPVVKEPQLKLTPADRRFLRTTARRTWRYFADFVGAASAWLPPDNYQVSPPNELALRTSPTNIGLALLSTLAAHDFGYITLDQILDTVGHTLHTVGQLERYEGHLLNWYDIKTLKPLEPRYVSFVDSGNLLGALWTLEHGLDELMHRPVWTGTALEGLQDTRDLVRDVSAPAGLLEPERQALAELTAAWEPAPARLADALGRLRRTAASVQALAAAAGARAGVAAGPAYWAGQLESQTAAWLGLADRYLTWLEILNEKTEAQLAPLGPAAGQAIRAALEQAPSLADLAAGRVPGMPLLAAIRAEAPAAASPLSAWLDRVWEAFAQAQQRAAETLAAGQQLIQAGRALSAAMNMRFLYDPARRLFSIGYNVSDGRLDNAYYDLLASEARLGSFVAIARGDVPVEHWFSMSRPYTVIGGRRALLSWSGTLFEYLMPLLFQEAPENTLLGEALRAAVAVHMDYGRQRHVPWGISESAYADLDLNQTYQYKAFGVPELGLKRGLEAELVVAPYATLLAVNLAPREALKNLRRLAGLGLLSEYGYFEALDFSRQPSRAGQHGVIIQAYMAHHQGMAFLALTNLLQGNPLQRHFHADARVRAMEPLLHERIPSLTPVHQVDTRERPPAAEPVGAVAPSESKFDTPHTPTPKTQLLSNGRYSVMVTNAGGGYSQWGNFEITRWRSDRTRDAWGTFCYLRDTDSDRAWANTYQPVGGKVEAYAVNFALDRAVFQRTDNGIRTETEIVVSPEDDVEIRRLTFINRSVLTRHLNLTSYVELSLAPHNADRQHPAFNKLFIETEAVPEYQALLAYRRPRQPDDPPIFVAHRLTLDQPQKGALQFETDRRRFIGRGRTLARPMGAHQTLGNSQGYVLDPCLSLRQDLTLNPGQRVQVSLVLAAGATRQQALGLMGKYGDPHVIERALDFAWAAAQLELRVLRLQPDEARRFQQLASHLLFPNPLLRPPVERTQENNKGQAGLWPYGLSGDWPIALVTIGEARDLGLVRQMLQAHAYWRLHGLLADLVILNEEASSYEHPLRERLMALIQANSTYTGLDRPGGVFLRSADQIPREDLTLLLATASVVLVAARGTLPQQLGVAAEVLELPEPLPKKRAPQEPSAPLPFMELPYFNGLGGFTSDGKEYAIYLGPNTHTPAPWVNVIANPTFGTLVSETGSGFTWYGNSQRNRLTQWSNDPVMDPAAEALYIRDEETGVYWTPTAAPIREDTAYRARHGAGYTVFEHNSHGIEQELTVFVPAEAAGGEPVKLQKLVLKNASARRRTLSVTYYVEWTLGENRESSQMHISTQWDDGLRGLVARNRYHPDYGDRIAFAAIHPPAESYSGNRTSFVGRNGSLSHPAGMERTRRSRRTGPGLDPCAAQQVTLELAPGAVVTVTCLLGQTDSVEAARGVVAKYREGRALDSALSQSKTWWDDLLGALEVHTPERAADFLINRWLLYQSLSCRIWGRSAFYQSGGAFGFRDQLQDVMAFADVYPDLTRRHILLAASRQFKEGDVQHWWHPPSGAGIRSRISDDPLWLPYVVAHYVRVSGDVALLKVEAPFLDGPALRDDQSELFSTPAVTDERATIFEHCRRALARGLKFGPHGLPLMGTGDWNDGLNRVGAGGTGESVWLGWFLAEVLQAMAALAGQMSLPEVSADYQQQRAAVLAHIDQAAWDGEWYQRAIFDDGTPLGAAANTEAQIDSLPQSWAWLSGSPDQARAGQALDSAWQRLVREKEGLVLLLAPPFEHSQPSPGYIQGYPPGVRENGGQYTHAALWFAMALARRGEGTRAAKMLSLLNPIEHARDADSVWRYGVEPYVVTADVYQLAGHVGQGGWSWYTGSAAWMYRAWVEEVLGLHVRGDQLRVDPVIPAGWPSFSLRYRHGEAVYEIQVDNPDGCERGVAWVELDGQRLPEAVIPLERGLVKHRAIVHLGQPPLVT